MIFVTGGTGLVGSHLLFDLIKSGKCVRALKRSKSNFEVTKRIFSYYSDDSDTLFNTIHWVEGDVLDIYSLYDALDGVDFVYHCAANVSFSPTDKGITAQTNSEGTANMVNASLHKGVKKLCHVSSITALGNANDEGFIDEECFWVPSSHSSTYSVSKYNAEREVWRGIEEGLNAVIVNPAIILGPGDWGKGSSQIFKTVWEGLNYYTKGVNGYVDVRDVSKAMIMLMESNINSQRFVLSSENIDYQTLLNYMADGFNIRHPQKEAGPFLSGLVWRMEKIKSAITNKEPLITKETAYMANRNYFYSAGKIAKAIGFEFIPIEQTVKDCIKIFKPSLS